MRDVHDEHGDAERDPEYRTESQQSRWEALNAMGVSVLPAGKNQHGGNHDAAVDEVDDRVRGRGRLIAEVGHELCGGVAAFDEREYHRDRGQCDQQGRQADGCTHEPGPVLASMHDSSAKEEQPDHQQSVGDQGGDVGAAQDRIDGGVDGVDVQGHRDRNGDGGVGDASVGAFSADDEQAHHEHPHECRDENLCHPNTSR